jgi:hypothetical protein
MNDEPATKGALCAKRDLLTEKKNGRHLSFYVGGPGARNEPHPALSMTNRFPPGECAALAMHSARPG